MTTTKPRVYRLQGKVQNYAWGRVGKESTVAQLYESSTEGREKVDPSTPYAELWMGTHSKAPSEVVLPNGNLQDLREFFQAHPELMGTASSSSKPGQLPYLLKVLSVNKTLSIQAHPDKALAEKLRREDPEHYLDDNHKPEMAIAITPFEGMCGFRPLTEVAAFLDAYPELHALVGDDAATAVKHALEAPLDKQKAALKGCFSSLMHADPKMVEAELKQLQERLEKKGEQSDVEKYVLRVSGQFPGDVGCFCLFLLNTVCLQPGEAIFLGPNLPHAYMAGDCIECMAASDNVVRAGCTSKFKDVDNLVGMLTYNMAPAKDQLFKPQPHPDAERITVYDPPVPDFTVARIEASVHSPVELPVVSSASIVIVTDGSGALVDDATGEQLSAPRGSTFLVGANATVTILPTSTITLFRASC